MYNSVCIGYKSYLNPKRTTGFLEQNLKDRENPSEIRRSINQTCLFFLPAPFKKTHQYYQGKKFVFIQLKELIDIRYSNCNYFSKIFRFNKVRFAKKIPSTSWQNNFYFVNWLWKQLLQVLCADFLIFVLDWWESAS